jgi:hypothetical protein
MANHPDTALSAALPSRPDQCRALALSFSMGSLPLAVDCYSIGKHACHSSCSGRIRTTVSDPLERAVCGFGDFRSHSLTHLLPLQRYYVQGVAGSAMKG